MEDLTGVVNGELVALEALEGDGLCQGQGVDIRDIHIRNLIIDVSRQLAVRLLCHDGRKITNVLVEAAQDVSVPENKMAPTAAVALGSVQLATKKLCDQEDLSNVTVRDVYSRGYKALELGGNSQQLRISNVHGFGSCGSLLSVRGWADSRGLSCSGMFFRCIQGSPYMRGTATSVITDPKKYLGAVFVLNNFKATDALMEHIRAEKVGNAFVLKTSGKVTVRDWQIGQIGRGTTVCDEVSTLVLEDPSL